VISDSNTVCVRSLIPVLFYIVSYSLNTQRQVSCWGTLRLWTGL